MTHTLDYGPLGREGRCVQCHATLSLLGCVAGSLLYCVQCEQTHIVTLDGGRVLLRLMACVAAWRGPLHLDEL